MANEKVFTFGTFVTYIIILNGKKTVERETAYLPRVRKLCEVLAASNVSSCNDSVSVHHSNDDKLKSVIRMPRNDSGKKQTGGMLQRSYELK